MTSSPYDAPEKSARREQTTIWRDGEVIRRDGWGRLSERPSLPPLPDARPTEKEIKEIRYA